jgi:hypothetical protein
MIVPGGITGAGPFTIGHRGTNGEEFLMIAGAMKAVAEVMVEVLIGNEAGSGCTKIALHGARSGQLVAGTVWNMRE